MSNHHPTPQTAEVFRHSVVMDPDRVYASLEEVKDLADKVVNLQGEIQQHDHHAQQLVAQALETMLDRLPAALEEATERAMRRVMTDKTLHAQVGASVLEQAKTNVHQTAGRWVLSKWAGIALLVVFVAQYIGWGATVKAVLGLWKGGAP